MKSQRQVDWAAIRSRAAAFPEEAFQFVREGLAHTVNSVHGEVERDASRVADERYHVTGQQLCLGLRDLALERYGMLARTVMNKWGVRRTDDFGVMVYALIDRNELRAGERDCFDDFCGVFDFDEAFAPESALR
ncbi:MAG: hypothetical protein KF768_05335 [Phycisphaeraceae bacterium]|nr:hypothetical protein [Phycisphaeraceae bacterium]